MPATSAQERSAKLVQRAKATNEKAQLQLCQQALKVHGTSATAVTYNNLVSLGFIDDVAKVVNIPEGYNERKRPSQELDEHRAELANKPMPKWGATWSDSPVMSIATLLGDIEPTVLSMSNLKLTGRKHSKCLPKASVMQLFEFCTDLDPGALVVKFDRYVDMVQWVCTRNENAGRKATCVTLPVNWDEDGIYTAVHSEGHWWLQNRFTDQAVKLDQVNDPDGVLSLKVDQNWSINRAVVRDATSSNIQEPCKTFFNSDAKVGTSFVSPGKRPKLLRGKSSSLAAPGASSVIDSETTSGTGSEKAKQTHAITYGQIAINDSAGRPLTISLLPSTPPTATPSPAPPASLTSTLPELSVQALVLDPGAGAAENSQVVEDSQAPPRGLAGPRSRGGIGGQLCAPPAQ